MNIKRAKEEIKDTIQAYLLKDNYGEYEIPPIRQRPVLLLGAPGIGKTQIMEQIAQECKIGLVAYTITHHTRQSAIGLPFISQKEYGGEPYSVTEYTMSEIVASVYEKIEHSGLTEGILFIDEINCVSETLAPAMLQFLQCKTFGNHGIPQGWLIVAAGNPPEYNKSVREFDVVTMDRVKKTQVEPDFEAWKEYAYRQQIHPAVLSYLNGKPGNFYHMENTVDGKQFATPRGWEDLSRLIQVYEKLGKAVDREVVVQYIQYPKAARDFANYLELYYKYRTDYQVEKIFQGSIDPAMVKKLGHAPFDERLGVVGLLLAGCGREFARVYREKLYMDGLFAQLKELKEAMAVPGTEGQALVEQRRDNTRYFLEDKRRAKVLQGEEEHTLEDIINALDGYAQKLKREHITENGQAFAAVRGYFAQEKQAFEDGRAEAGQVLERAFDFMEAAFLNSQEMVVFLTELNANYYSVCFLESWDCPRYYQYNKSLLFEENQQRLLGRIEALRKN